MQPLIIQFKQLTWINQSVIIPRQIVQKVRFNCSLLRAPLSTPVLLGSFDPTEQRTELHLNLTNVSDQVFYNSATTSFKPRMVYNQLRGHSMHTNMCSSLNSCKQL